jgi:CHAD domain-containing protein
MAYRLKKSESVPDGIRRIVVEEIDSAAEHLGKTKDRDEAVHEARKSLKKVRGLLRLVQPELGRVYQRENTQLRGIGRKLSELRDATAIIEVFDGLVDKYKDQLRKDALVCIRRGLENSKRETEQAVDAGKTVQQAVATLRSERKRVKDWPLKLDGFDALAAGLKERYRRGRKAMAAAKKQQTPETFHEWRKRVKDHWYHVRLLESAWTDLLQAREGSLKNLETWLGDDHNLVVLCAKINEHPDFFGEPADIQLFLALSAQFQKELRGNSLSLGERLYEEEPGQFTKNMSKLWDAWQAQPKSLKEAEPAQKRPAKSEAAEAKKSAVA